MITQLTLGSALTLASIMIATVSWWVLEAILAKLNEWSATRPHGPKLIAVLTLSLISTLFMMTCAVWLWAAAFYALDVFVEFEKAVYFALVSFTTLGFGDIILPQEWRLLGGMAAANGLLLFGLLTAILVETLRGTRSRQREERED